MDSFVLVRFGKKSFTKTKKGDHSIHDQLILKIRINISGTKLLK